MDSALESALQDLWQHVTASRQAWLLGAGVSFGAGIPLMFPLTRYVETRIAEHDTDKVDLLRAIREQLPEEAHIEHVLSQIGDLVALADRTKTKVISVGEVQAEAAQLRELHGRIVHHIGDAVRYGYRPARGNDGEVRGTPSAPIVQVCGHRAFIRTLFAARVKPGISESPITFFTTNYDTLIEDALALERVRFVDGFLGGAMGFWSPGEAYSERTGRERAKVVKLHGSVDWHLLDDGSLVRCRNGCAYPDKQGNLMIYPQSTKYVATQRDPFAGLFAQLRETLSAPHDNVLGVCGYSFGDEHINGEIEAAMSRPGSKTVLVAFTDEPQVEGIPQLPSILQDWLTDRPWRNQVFVASSRGLYHGSLANLFSSGTSCAWWTFEGLTRYLADGPEVQTRNSAPAEPPVAEPTEVTA